MAAPDVTQYVAAIYSKCWWVRHYQRGGRSNIEKEARAASILALGLVCREAFGQCRSDDFEALLAAIVDGLNTKTPPPF